MRARKKKAAAALFMLLLFAGASAVDALNYECAGADSCADGSTPTVVCSPFLSGDCAVRCAVECGGLAPCTTGSCETCCSATACSKYADGSLAYAACQDSCKGTCEANSLFCYVILVFQSVGAGIAVIMLIINGIKWILAEDPAGRTDARRGVIYVLIGIGILLIAFALVNYLLAGDLVCA